jgi:hypothetical protein
MQHTEGLWRVPAHPFWAGWFSGATYAQLATVFVLLSVADFTGTLALIPQGVREGNALAATYLEGYGTPGFALYKAALVTVVLLATWVLARHRPRTAHLILWGGLLVTGLVVLRHLAIVAGFATFAQA